MRYLYGKKKNGPWRLVATFDSDQQLLAYVRWATLERGSDNTGKFEQGSALAGAEQWRETDAPEHVAQSADVPHNPSPSML